MCRLRKVNVTWTVNFIKLISHQITTLRFQLWYRCPRVTKDIVVILKNYEHFFKRSDKYHMKLMHNFDILDKDIKRNNIWIANNFFLKVFFEWAMIFVHPFHDNYGDNLDFLCFYWSKIMRREKERERIIISCVSIREKVVKNL